MRDLRDFKEVCFMAASFQNMATLTYTGGTVDSNIVTGELREVLTVVKTAVE